MILETVVQPSIAVCPYLSSWGRKQGLKPLLKACIKYSDCGLRDSGGVDFL